MCHWVRDAEFERERSRAALPPSEPVKRPSRKLVGALGAVAAAAVAAFVLLLPVGTPADAPPPAPTAAAPAVPVAAPAVPVATAPAERVPHTEAAPDDPAPVATAGKSAGSHCSHDM